MNLDHTAEEIAFRDDVHAFIAKNLPAGIAAKVHGGKRLGRDDYMTCLLYTSPSPRDS